MSSSVPAKHATFDEFYAALEAERHISERITNHPEIGDQLRASLQKLFNRVQNDPAFEQRLLESPQDTALGFLHDEISQYSLSDDDLESVAGGKVTLDSTLGYDIGYVIGSTVEFVVDFFD